MTAKTPIYALEYIVQGEPVRNTRLALENNAKTIEAALVRGGIAPPAAQDLATLSGRVTTTEGRISALEPGPWQTPTLNSGWSALGVTYPPPRYRLRSPKLLELDGLLNTGGSGTIFVLPAAYRPKTSNVVPALHGDTGTRALFVEAAGNVLVAGGATTTWLSIHNIIPLD